MKTTKKAELIALIFAVATVGSLSSLSFTESASVKPGNFLVNAGINFGTGVNTADFGKIDPVQLGGIVSADYALPWVALTVGLETGYEGGDLTYGASYGRSKYTGGYGVIPILARIGYHPDFFGSEKIDLYFVGKIGVGIGFFTPTGDSVDAIKSLKENAGMTTPFGFAYGINAGFTYYFTNFIGINLEAGWADTLLKYTTDYGYGKQTDFLYGRSYAKVGVAFKF